VNSIFSLRALAAEIFPKRRKVLCCLAAETAAVHATRSKSESMNSKIAEQSRLFAFASFADAENLGKFSAERAVFLQISLKPPFMSLTSTGFQARLSLRSFSARNQSKKPCAP